MEPRPAFVLGAHEEDFMGVHEVLEGVGSVPEFVLPPEAVDHGGEQVGVIVDGLGGQEARLKIFFKAEPFAPKKSEAPQRIASMQRRRVRGISNSTSGTP